MYMQDLAVYHQEIYIYYFVILEDKDSDKTSSIKLKSYAFNEEPTNIHSTILMTFSNFIILS